MAGRTYRVRRLVASPADVGVFQALGWQSRVAAYPFIRTGTVAALFATLPASLRPESRGSQEQEVSQPG